MRFSIFANLVFLVLLTGYSFSTFSQSFEGTIKTIVREPFNQPAESELMLFIKGNKFAMETNYGEQDDKIKLRFIPDLKNNEMLMLTSLTSSKFYKRGKPDGRSALSDKYRDIVQVEHSGETMLIMGFNCEKIIIKTGAITTSCWYTKELDINYGQYESFLQNDYNVIGLAHLGISGFPMKSETREPNGNIIQSYQVLEINPGIVADKEFAIPPGFVERSR